MTEAIVERESGAALVLCGGSSRRMGCDKTALPFGGESLLERVVRIVAGVVPEVWLVAREGQQLAVRGSVEAPVQIARDSAEGLGPLAALVAGLGAMRAEYAFVSADEIREVDPELNSLRGCDTPDAYREALRIAAEHRLLL